MSSSKPTIGVTGPVKGGTPAWWFTAFAVWLQGGRAVRIHPGRPRKEVVLDGLIIGGGADINPERYGALLEQPAEEKSGPAGRRRWVTRLISLLFYPLVFLIRYLFSAKDPRPQGARDELETELLEEACERKIPVLGICRGAQLINVKFGGTLHQDISGFYTEVPKPHTIWPRKTVDILPGTGLRQVTGTSRALVNALHNQAVDRLGEELQVTATEESGIIQGVEHPGYPFLLGVQWHPEYMPQIPLQRKIFEALVSEARRARDPRS